MKLSQLGVEQNKEHGQEERQGPGQGQGQEHEQNDDDEENVALQLAMCCAGIYSCAS